MNCHNQKQYLKERLQEHRKRFLKPPTTQPLSEWALDNFVLGRDSALPGKFTFDRAEYQREVWDTIGDPKHNRVVISAASQTLKTQAILCFLAYTMAEDPAPTLVVNSTGALTETFSKARFASMLETVPVLRGLVNPSRQRDSGNTIKYKDYPGGFTKMGTAGSVTDLSSLAIRYLACDECSRYEPTKEGDSVALAEKRTTTFANRKVLLVSSPSEEGNCNITDEFKTTDQRYYHVPCPKCSEFQKLEWAQVKWWDGDPHTSQYECAHCNSLWTEAEKNAAVRWGKWIPEHPENSTPGFSISSLYSSFVSIRELAEEFLNAKHAAGTDKLQAFTNTRLAQTWKNMSHTVEGIDFGNRLEDYEPDSIPNKIALITAGVDTQKNRLEMSVYGWGIGDESWLIEHVVFNGSPDLPEVWEELKEYFTVRYTRKDGINLPIHAFCIDSGGLSTQAVYKFCTKHYKRRVYAIKGMAGPKPIFPIQHSKAKGGGRVWLIGVDTAKDLIYNLLTISDPGAGYVHFPESLIDYPEFFDQLTAEKWKDKYQSGRKFKQWFAIDGKPTEALDCRVYAQAARESVKLDLDKRAAKLDKKAEEIQETSEKQQISMQEAAKTVNKVKKRKRANRSSNEWGSNFK